MSYTDKRDTYDDNMKVLETRIDDRHEMQGKDASVAQLTDDGWKGNRRMVNDLNTSIQERRKNYDTYKHAIEVEKTLYNRERHRTVLLSIANALALSGCLYVWLA